MDMNTFRMWRLCCDCETSFKITCEIVQNCFGKVSHGALRALISLNSPDWPHLVPPPTPMGPGVPFKLTWGRLFPPSFKLYWNWAPMLGCEHYCRNWIPCLTMDLYSLRIGFVTWTPTWSWTPKGWALVGKVLALLWCNALLHVL